jgi:hypothetical protein
MNVKALVQIAGKLHNCNAFFTLALQNFNPDVESKNV